MVLYSSLLLIEKKMVAQINEINKKAPPCSCQPPRGTFNSEKEGADENKDYTPHGLNSVPETHRAEGGDQL